MNLWQAVIMSTLEVEGGLVDHPNDPGGLTNWGISQRAYPDLDIRELTREEAIAIYHRDYWLPIPDTLPDAMRWMLFDCAVNHGLKVARDWARAHASLEGLVAARLRFYTNLTTWPTFGKGWTRRVATVLDHIHAYERTKGRASTINTLVLHEFFDSVKEPIILRSEFATRQRQGKLDVRRVR